MSSFTTLNLISCLVFKAGGSKTMSGINQSANFISKQIQFYTAELILAQVSTTDVLN